MPFHSDADEFPDEAFEEATKVRALDELIAQTAESDARPENTSRGRLNGRGDATVTNPAPERAERAEQLKPPMVLPSHPEPQEVPDLPNPPELARPQPRLLDTSPSPRIESLPPSLPDALAKTRLGVEPARARVAPSTPPPPIAPMLGEVPPLPSGMRAVAHEQTEPARMPELKSRSMAPLLILIFLVVAAGGAAVWFFVLRQQIGAPHDHGTAAQPTGSAGSAAAGSAVAADGSGSARVAAAPPPVSPPVAGTGAVATGSAAPAADTGAKGEIAETEITASIEGATVEITGTDQAGPAPFTARLEKGKVYKARIIARGFATLEIDLQGGDPKVAAKLVAKPRFLNLASEPSGAQISIDGTPTGKTTPSEIELTAAQATKKAVRVVMRKPGFRAVNRSIDFARFTDDDTRMTARLEEKMVPAPAPATSRPPAGTGSTRPPPPPPGPGSDTGNGAGSSDTAAPGGGSAQGAPGSDTPSAAPTPPPAPPAGAGSSAGSSAEPEPDFNKPK